MIVWVISPASSLFSFVQNTSRFSPSLSDAEKPPFSDCSTVIIALVKLKFLREQAWREDYNEKNKREKERDKERKTIRDTIAKNSEYVYAGGDIF